MRPEPGSRGAQASAAPPRALTGAQSVFVALVAVLVFLELVLVPYEVRYPNGLITWLGYHFFWSPPAPELPGERVIQAGLVVAEVAGTLLVAFLMFPRGRATGP